MPFMNISDCFDMQMKFWKILGIDPFKNSTGNNYNFYVKLIVSLMVFLFNALLTVDCILEQQLDSFIENMLLYVTLVSISSKIITFIVMHEEIANIIKTIDKDVFQPVTEKEIKIINDAKRFNKLYWKTVTVMSLTSHVSLLLKPLIRHLLMPVELELPINSCSFIPEEIKQHFIFPLYLYQSLVIHYYLWSFVNINTFFLGLMILVIVQLDILDGKLRNITNYRICLNEKKQEKYGDSKNDKDYTENELIQKLKESIVHFDEVSKFCSLIQDVFEVALFIEFGGASITICMCLFRFTLPAPLEYLIFLVSYIFLMMVQILVPCWFGTRIIDKSNALSEALYNCDWIARPRRFKTNLRLFVERTSKPLTIIGWKMFPLSLTTFSSILKNSYSFFTVLRHIQSRQ